MRMSFTCRASMVVACCASWLLVAPSAGAQRPVFRARVDAVRVDVLVTRGRRPIDGLAAGDFELLDNGVPQRVELSEHFRNLPINVVLALDASESVTGERLDHLRAASNRLIEGLDRKDKAALITFNDILSLQVEPTNDLARVKEAIDAIRPSGATLLIDATYASIVFADSGVGRNLLVLFTDGVDTGSYLRREAVVDAAKRSDVVVYAVVVALRGRPSFVEDVTSQTGGRVLETEGFRDLPAAFAQILAEFRGRYVLSYSPTGVDSAGWHQIEVKVKNRRASVRARPGYFR